MLHYFVSHLTRAFQFQALAKKNGDEIWDKADFLKDMYEKWEEKQKDLLPDVFLGDLYDKLK